MNRAENYYELQRVRMTDAAVEQGFQGRATSRFGLVVSVAPPFRIKVWREGLKSANWYHCDFWEPAP